MSESIRHQLAEADRHIQSLQLLRDLFRTYLKGGEGYIIHMYDSDKDTILLVGDEATTKYGMTSTVVAIDTLTDIITFADGSQLPSHRISMVHPKYADIPASRVVDL